MNDKEHPPQHNHSQEIEQHEVTEVLNFLKRYGKLIGTAVLVAAVTLLVSRGLAHRKAAKIAEAETLLMNAGDPQQLEEIVNNYGSTPAAPVALLDLAKTIFNAGDAVQARAYYKQFLKKYKDHDMRPVAEIGLAYCTEADGNFNDAVELFSDFITANKTSYLQPLAVLGMSRCMAQAGRVDAARIVLEDFLAENPGSPWAGPAEGALAYLNQ